MIDSGEKIREIAVSDTMQFMKTLDQLVRARVVVDADLLTLM